MHLSDGRGGQRDGIKLSEELPRGSTELARDHLGDRFGGDGGHIILELAQFGDIVGRQKVRTRAQDLAELDQGGPKLLHHQAKMFGTGVGRRPPGMPEPAALERHQAPEPELDHHKTEAVAGHRRRDLAEALMCREREAGPAAVHRAGSRWRPLWLRSAHDHFRSRYAVARIASPRPIATAPAPALNAVVPVPSSSSAFTGSGIRLRSHLHGCPRAEGLDDVGHYQRTEDRADHIQAT